MTRLHDALTLEGVLVLAMLVTGCHASPAAPATAQPTGANLDQCAERLHDICGQVLLYYSARGDLPQRLADFAKSGRGPALPLTCPLSGRPYAYSRQGLPVSGWPGRLIVYDAEPCHSGLRWGILAESTLPGQPLVLRVIRFPDTAMGKESQRTNP